MRRWAGLVYRRRWVVLLVGVLVAALAGLGASSVSSRLEQGGYDIPGSETERAARRVERVVGKNGADIIAVYTTPGGPSLTATETIRAVRRVLDELPPDLVRDTTGWWDQPALITPDRDLAAVAIDLEAADYGEIIEAWHEIRPLLEADGNRYAIDALRVGFTGPGPVGSALTDQAERDLVKAELVSFPILLILLVLVFGGLVAAGVPIVIGALGIVSSLGILRLLVEVTSVTVFAMNVVTLLGLGLAIDYGLFVVSRFREELRSNSGDVPAALATTMATAGRTVLVSGLTVLVALSSLLIFPMGMLRSIGLGGMAAVVVAVTAAVTLLPALLAVLGTRIDAFAVLRRRAGEIRADEEHGWGRFGRAVMTRPAAVIVVVVGLLVLAGSPFLDVRFGQADASVLPADNPVRVATEHVSAHLPAVSGDGASIVVTGANSPPTEDAVAEIVAEAEAVPGVLEVMPTDAGGDVVVLTARLADGPQSSTAQEAVRQLREVDPPDGVSDLLVGGFTASIVDSVDALGDRIPLMLTILAGAILVLLLLAFGSLLVPIKAVVVGALSLSASFGVVVWIFVDGNLVDLLGVHAGPLDPTLPVLMLAVLFGLSTDYEVFLLARIAEGYRAGLMPRDAVVYGLARTGPIISAAALLLMVVIGAFALSGLSFMKILGIGMLIAIVVDATIVRGLLVPAVLALLGRAAWWGPGPLARLQRAFRFH